VLSALEGLTFETMILAPFALAAMAWWWAGSPTSFPGPDLGTNLWLIGLGPATTLPLLLFAFAARRISLTTLGLMQYLGPSIQFVLGLVLFGEPLTPNRLIGFAMIWTALAIYTTDGIRTHRKAIAVTSPPAPEPQR
jgi:chloramphenicol-sensitive protein RarD